MKFFTALCCIAFLAIISNGVSAQKLKSASENLYEYEQLNGTKGSTATPPPAINREPVQKIPFDGGLTLFLAAGAGLAMRKKYMSKKHNK